jgi:predicted RNA binding protein YcfA (HicA-like mRNA interferase family)
LKVREIIERLEAEGWILVRMKGSHRQYKHSAKKSLVTVAGKLSDEPSKKTPQSIFKQAGWK